MKQNFISTMLLIVSASFLSACGSGGGGGTDSSVMPSYPIGGGSGGGSGSAGGTAQAAYYGVTTDNSPALTNQLAPASGNSMVIPNQVAMVIHSQSSRSMDLMIYQPTCVLGYLTEEYTAVLVSSVSQTAPTVGTVTVAASAISFQEHSVAETVGMSATVYDYNPLVNYSGTCTSGEMILSSGGGTLYSNGNLLVWKTAAGDVYLGANKSKIVSGSADLDSSSTPRSYARYTQIFSGSQNPNSPLGPTWTSDNGSVDATSTAFFSSKRASGFGGSTTSASTYWANLANGSTSSSSVTIKVGGASSSESPFYGFAVSSVGSSGKAMTVVAARRAAANAVFSNNGTSTTDIKGSGAFIAYVQN